MKRSVVLVAGASLALVWAAALVARAAPQASAPATAVDYKRQVQPIIATHCLECHSKDRRKGGLSLATYDDILEGGRNGPVVRPSNGAGSLIVHRLSGTTDDAQMPKDEDPLEPAQIALVKTWIDQGARETPASPPAAAPWEATLFLGRPSLPAIVWPAWSSPLDRFVSAHLRIEGRSVAPNAVADALFARRVYLDTWGLPPSPAELQSFLADRNPAKRAALVKTLLADNDKYAAHWISLWNDLLRNEDGVTYFSETAGRKSITPWLVTALKSNLPYDQFVRKLVNPATPADPEGFINGVNWRGETSAAVTPWMQASQNTAQVFLGINLKCNACHDSFISKWKLKDAYALAAYFSPDPKLQLYRCDVAQNRFAEPAFLFPEIGQAPASTTLADRRAAAAATFTDPRNGRLPRTLVNRIWHRLFGRGIVANPDEMDGRPWSPALLDFLASDFVDHGYDVKHLIETILTSRAYQMPAVPRTSEPSARDYVFAGPEVRRLTAEQFADAVGAITGEWNVSPGQASAATGGVHARDYQVASSNLTRALGRPIRDQVNSTRVTQASTLQALELVNGEIYTRWLSRGARRMLGELPPEPVSLFNRAVAGRSSASVPFDVDVSKATSLWLVVQENGSNVPEVIQPAWAQARFEGLQGVTLLSSLTPRDAAGLRPGSGAIVLSSPPPVTSALPAPPDDGVRVSNPSVLVYDIAGKGFERFRGAVGIENPRSEIGSTLNPQVRFFVFDAAPNMERLTPPLPGTPLPPNPPVTTIAEAIDRVFWHALGRAPSAAERRAAENALASPGGGTRPSAQGLADLLWAVTMKPEFQLIY
jgi:mono/diheme cytochrome c family protein